MRSTMLLDRRRLLAMSALGLCPAGTTEAQPSGLRQTILTIAGPAGGRLDRWAELIGGPVGRGLPGRAPLVRQNVGGLDGVTGANQFEARAEPDGSVALLVPGSAALSWLVGESRAKFDPARWLALWAVSGSAILVSRVALTPGHSVRVAAATPAGPELPALLALDLMGVNAIVSPMASADAILLQGTGIQASLAGASLAGMRPALVLSGVADVGPARDSIFSDVPTAGEIVTGRAPADMVAAMRAATLAVQLEAGLVLPQLTPASSVAMWRTACAPLLQDADVVAEATRSGVRLLSGSTVAACTSGIAGAPTTLLALRRWLATRYDWRPA